MQEEWRPIPEFEQYQISNFGRMKLKNDCISNSNSMNVALRKDNRNFWFKRSQLVLLTFRGPPPTDAEWNARHLNDDKSQNWLSNLAWGTSKDNHRDGVLNGKHHSKGSEKALCYGAPLRNTSRSQEIKDKISNTKRNNPHKIHRNRQDLKTGRWVA